MNGRLRAGWEGLCLRCGQCCYEKEIRGNTVVVNWRVPCGYLDLKLKQCRVYGERFHRCRDCRGMTIFHALFASYLPDDCGYVKAFRFWRRKSCRSDGRRRGLRRD